MKTKKKQLKRPPFIWSVKRVSLLTVAVLLIMILGWQAYLDLVVWRRSVSPGDQTAIINLVINSTNNLKQPAAVDARSGNNYFPPVRLQAPASSDPGHLLYSYQRPVSGFPAELQVTSSVVLQQAQNQLWIAQSSRSRLSGDSEAIFRVVPHLQACARGVHIFFAPPSKSVSNGLRDQGSFHVADGRTLYLYSEPSCQTELAPVVSDARQLQSY